MKWTIVVGLIALGLVSSASADDGYRGGTHAYTVGSLTVPGVDTGVVVKRRERVRVTATGVFCPGTGFCAGPDGSPLGNSLDLTWGGFTLPGEPAYGLIARIGTGLWVHVGSGPTTLSGKGVLVFAVNDDLYPDNTGGFTATVTYKKGRTHDCAAGRERWDDERERCDEPDGEREG